ncbi:3719_t:CDS:10, partial [Dentiscutata heterogama]
IGYNHPAVFKHSQWFKASPSRFLYSLGSRVYLSNIIRLPKIQYDFLLNETAEEEQLRESRRDSVKNGFLHAWNGYTRYAWGYDELLPLTNVGRNNFNGWGATIIDALDTMWIMDLKEEFNRSRDFVRTVDFTRSDDDINVFETTIRYLGGLLSAYELSNDLVFLEKAQELGNALLPSFDSPTGLPYNSWNLTWGINKKSHELSGPPCLSIRHCGSRTGILAQVGTMQLEFMKLSQLTGDSQFFFKVQDVIEILDRAEKYIPGLYPLEIDQDSAEFIGSHVSFGSLGDSFYEACYLLKVYVFVGGALDKYRRMYIESIESMRKYLIKEGRVRNRSELLFLGDLLYHDDFSGKMGHLTCFVPGMLAVGAKILDRPEDLEIAIRLAETCYWSYNVTLTGLGPEEFWFLTSTDELTQNEIDWLEKQEKLNNLPNGLTRISPTYLLRPETIESLFILYRITGDKQYQEKGWMIWQAIEKWCKTPTAYSGLKDVNTEQVEMNNIMES